MAGRVNTKFVVSLGLGVAVVTLGLAAVWYFLIQTSPAENIGKGDLAFQQGQIKEALFYYGKAVNKRPNNVEYLLKFVAATQRQIVEDPREAQQAVGRLRGMLDRATTLEPANPKPFEQLMGLYTAIGRDLGEFNAWNLMLERAQTTLNVQADSSAAHKYRGIAQVNRMRQLDVNDADRAKAREDLEMVVQKDPQDQEALFHLAFWQLLEARNLDRSGRFADRTKQLRDEARATAQKMAQANAGPRAVFDRTRVLVELDELDQAKALLDQLEAQLLAKPESVELVLEVAQVVSRLDRQPLERGPGLPATTRGWQRAEALLRAADKAQPNNIRILFALSQTLTQQRQTDQALETLKKVREMPLRATPVQALAFSQLQMGATLQYCDLMLNQANTLTDDAKRQALLNQVQDVVRQVTVSLGDTAAPVNLLAGKLAMAQGKWAEATMKLNRASAQYQDANPEALLLLAQASLRAGEAGTAADRLRALLRAHPELPAVRLELVRVEMQLRQYDQAKQDLDILTTAKYDDPAVAELQSTYLAQTGRIEQAIEAMQKLSPEKNPQAAQQLATLYAMAGRPDQARTLLEGLFTKNPKDVRILQVLLRLATTKEQALGYIQRGREGGADAATLDMLAGMLEQKGDMAEFLEQVIDKEPDPFQRALQRHAMFRRINQSDKADKELAEAAKLKPDDPRVIDAQFNRALEQRRWDEAQKLASRAGTLDLDLAKGLFYRGQLALTRNQFEQAARNFRLGLQDRPVFSEGWRQLGDAQRQLGEPSEALASYHRSLDQRPNNVAALRGLAMTLDAQTRRPEALEALRQAFQFAPGDQRLMRQYIVYEENFGDPQKALALRRQIDGASGGKDAANRRETAVLLARLKQPEEARQLMEQLLAAPDGKNPENLAAYATMLVLSGKTAEARRMLTEHVVGEGDKATSDDWLLLAKFLLSLGEDANALTAFERAIKLEDPSSRPASRELADLLFDRGEFVPAAEHYQKLYEVNAQDTRVGQRYVETLLRAGKLDEAEKAIQEVLTVQGPDANICMLQGLLARAKGDDELALKMIRRSLELAPSRPLLHYQLAEQLISKPGREKEALAALERALELDANMMPARMLTARINLRLRNSEEAIRQLQMVIKLAPSFVPGRILLAQVYQDAGQNAALDNLLDESSKLFPRDTNWLRWQARRCMDDKKPDEAQKKLEAAVKISASPENLAELAQFYLGLKQSPTAEALLAQNTKAMENAPLLRAVYARALFHNGKIEAAQTNFVTAFQNCQSFAQVKAVNDQTVGALGVAKTMELLQPLVLGQNNVWVQVVMTANEVTDERFTQAIERVKQIDLLVPKNTAERLLVDGLYAMSLHRTGKHAEAEAIYRRILATDPQNLLTLNNLAYLLVENLGKVREGLEMAQKAADLAEDGQVLDTLGWAQFKNGLSTDALKTLQRSVELSPQSAANHYHLAEVLLSVERKPAAVQHLEEAKRLAEQTKDSETLEAAGKRLASLKN